MQQSKDPKIIGLIPARYASKRFPGKPLVEIQGKSLIQRVYENASKAQILDEVAVATDDQRIYDHVKAFGGNVFMTGECSTGTDRIADVVRNEVRYQSTEIVVNIQGDEPCLNPVTLDAIIAELLANPNAVVGTPVVPITDPYELEDPSKVKCVFDQNGRALYFSRSCIPHAKTETTIYKHIGLYAFRKPFLLQFASLPDTPLYRAEDLEQLKILESGYAIQVAVVQEESIGVDTPQDITRIEKLLCRQNISLSQEGSAHP